MTKNILLLLNLYIYGILNTFGITLAFNSPDFDVTDNGDHCATPCGQDGLFRGRYWCHTFDAWDFCGIHSNKVEIDGFIQKRQNHHQTFLRSRKQTLLGQILSKFTQLGSSLNHRLSKLNPSIDRQDFFRGDISDNGLHCETPCGKDGLFEGRHWCHTFDAWDFCEPKQPKPTGVEPNGLSVGQEIYGFPKESFIDRMFCHFTNFASLERQAHCSQLRLQDALAGLVLYLALSGLITGVFILATKYSQQKEEIFPPIVFIRSPPATTTTTTEAPTTLPETTEAFFFREGREYDGPEHFIEELLIKSQCTLDYGIPNNVILDLVFCQKEVCCSIGELPLVTPDCNESDSFTNSQLGYCSNFDFDINPIKGHVTVSLDEEEDFSWAGDYIKIKLMDESHFDCQINDVMVKNGAISEFDCQYFGNQQVIG